MLGPTHTRSATAILLLVCGLAAASAGGDSRTDEQKLRDIKEKIMSADYRADLEEIARGREQLTTLKHHPRLGYLACYWAGFAGLRLAMNGANRGMTGEEMERNLYAAIDDLDAGLRLREDFADAHAVAANVTGWLIGIVSPRDGPERARGWIERTRHHIARGLELAPRNPRLLWVQGGSRYNTPAQYGGSQTQGMELWRQAAELSRAEPKDDPLLPDWGEPEAVMSVAWGLLHGSPSDPVAAREWAENALRLRPDWFYVREILLPMIEERLATCGSATKPRPSGARRSALRMDQGRFACRLAM